MEDSRHRLDGSPGLLAGCGAGVVVAARVTLARLARARVLEPARGHRGVADAGDGVDRAEAVQRRLAKVRGWRAVRGVRGPGTKRRRRTEVPLARVLGIINENRVRLLDQLGSADERSACVRVEAIIGGSVETYFLRLLR